jgi:hypothetical protein
VDGDAEANQKRRPHVLGVETISRFFACRRSSRSNDEQAGELRSSGSGVSLYHPPGSCCGCPWLRLAAQFSPSRGIITDDRLWIVTASVNKGRPEAGG